MMGNLRASMAPVALVRKAGIAAIAVAGLFASQAFAGIVGVNSSTHTISHDSGFGPVDGFGPAVVQPYLPPVEYSQTLNNGPNTSWGGGNAGYIVRPDLGAIGFPVGMGVSQNRVDAVGHTEASLRMDFTIVFDVLNSFGPPAFSFANLPISGVVSDDGWARFSYGATVVGAPGGLIGGPLGGTYFTNTPGAFAVLFNEINFNGNFVNATGTLTLNGFVKFEAFDNTGDAGLSSIEFSANAGTLPAPVPAALPMLAAAIGGLVLLRRSRNAA